MAHSLRALLLLLAAGFLTSAAFAGNWGRFRGPNGTGTVDDKDVPLTFGPKDNVLWKVPINGTGNASPIVWGKHLFLHAASNDAKERSLLCFDTTNGKIRWQKSIPGSPIRLSRGDTSHASSTPTTDGEAVYISFWNGKNIIIAAYDFQGQSLWSKDLGPWYSQHGPGASPILYKDKLILANDMDGYIESKDKKTKKPVPVKEPSLLLALNKNTGEVLWQAQREADRACYSAPFLLTKPGQTEPELIVTSMTAVTAYNPDSGAKLWEAKGWQGNSGKMLLRTVASPALAEGVLIASSGDGSGDRLAVGIALPSAGSSDVPARLWDNDKDFPYVPCALAKGEHFYFVNDKGYAGCYEAKTGKRVWYRRIAESAFLASPLLINGKVYALSETGEMYVFTPSPTFEPPTRNELLASGEQDERFRPTPAVADGRLYIRGERNLYCICKAK
jgi:outer membrane protein assembly factor BamB